MYTIVIHVYHCGVQVCVMLVHNIIYDHAGSARALLSASTMLTSAMLARSQFMGALISPLW